MKGLEATLGQPRVISGGNGTNSVLEEPQFIRKGTVVSGENDGTHDDIRVTVYVFRNAVVYDVGTLEERGGVERREECVVYENEGSGGMRFGEADDSWDIYQSKGRVCGRLDPDKFGIGAESREDCMVILVLEVHVRTGDALVLARHALNVSVGSAVYIVDADDVSVGTKGVNHRGGSCRARSKGETVGSSLDSSKSGLQSVSIGVSRARVLESLNGVGRVSNLMGRRLCFGCEPCGYRHHPACRLSRGRWGGLRHRSLGLVQTQRG